jgi:signal transduction histidine kinase
MNFKKFRFVKKSLVFVVLLSLLGPPSADAGILDYLNALYSTTTTATTQVWNFVWGANQPSTASTTRPISPPQIIQETEQELERGLQRKLTTKPQKFKLNKVIEHYLARSKKIGLALENRFEQEYANPIRFKLAQKWTRNAATRIFFDYRRSFLELVVNACDAMQPNKESVGKFGMGFFSIFSFLDHEETNGTTITIRTTYKKENDRLFTYELKFEKDTDNDIQIGIKKLNLRSIVQPGTNIFIEPKEKEFSPETLKQLKDYVHYLDFYKPINVKVYDKDHKMVETIGSPTASKSILVVFRPDSIRVSDTGTGIPLSVVFTKLLIPSSTTKTSLNFQLSAIERL